jgi:hypothetical protein
VIDKYDGITSDDMFRAYTQNPRGGMIALRHEDAVRFPDLPTRLRAHCGANKLVFGLGAHDPVGDSARARVEEHHRQRGYQTTARHEAAPAKMSDAEFLRNLAAIARGKGDA